MNHQTLDEIDSEFVGSDKNNYWTNFFYRGRRVREKDTLNEVYSSHPVGLISIFLMFCVVDIVLF